MTITLERRMFYEVDPVSRLPLTPIDRRPHELGHKLARDVSDGCSATLRRETRRVCISHVVRVPSRVGRLPSPHNRDYQNQRCQTGQPG